MTKIGCCILCRKNNVILTEEHVIPDALGGKYKIYKLCKDCNSFLGAKIDSKFCNNFWGLHHRDTYQIKGKSKQAPFLLKGIGENDLGDKFIIEDIDSLKKPKKLDDRPKIKVTKLDNKKYSINISFSDYTVDQEKIKLLINKHRDYIKKEVSKKIDIDNKKIELNINSDNFTLRELTKKNLTIKRSYNIDGLELGSLKIAYEFILDKNPALLKHKDMIEISKILLSADETKAKKYFSVDYLERNSELRYLLQQHLFTTRRKLILLQCIFLKNKGTICVIHIFDSLLLFIKLSKKNLLRNLNANFIEYIQFLKNPIS